jgi:hypothetical protein
MILVTAILGCRPPIIAPEDLDGLFSYLYLHTMDEEQEEMMAGIINMEDYIEQNESELMEGYRLGHLSEEALQSTGLEVTYLEEQVGVSLLYKVPYSVEDIVAVNTIVDLTEVYPEDYLTYDREYLSDLDCFIERACDTLTFRSLILGALPLGQEIQTSNYNQLRWFDLESGPAMVHRSWMEGEGDATADWATFLAQYYIAIHYSDGEKNRTIAGSWAVLLLGDLPLPEDMVLSQALDGLQRNGDDITAYLDENGVPD